MVGLRITGVAAGQINLEKQGNLLRVRLGQFRRTLVLPDYMLNLQPAWARLAEGELQIALHEPGDS